METEKCRVLVVDDDAFVAEMLSVILCGGGYQVDIAGNGRAALDKLKEFPEIGLVISDMNMPEMDGLELIEAVRGGGSQVPIIILTGNSEISVAISALNKGASDYLLKDENIQETITISVVNVLEKHALKLKNRQLMEDLARKNRQLEDERVLARKIQENILPRRLTISGFETAAYYRASNQIGGDFFDAFETDSHIHFLIGDISGHSTSSALLMAVCKGMFISLGQTISEPLDIVTAANRMLCRMLMESGMFLTLVHASYDKQSGILSTVSAGHNPVYLLTGREISTIESTGPVLGWDPDDTWEVLRHRVEPDALLFLYTDGLVEARNRAGEEFGDLLLEKLRLPFASPEELVRRILDDLAGFCGESLEDDLTLFAIKRCP